MSICYLHLINKVYAFTNFIRCAFRNPTSSRGSQKGLGGYQLYCGCIYYPHFSLWVFPRPLSSVHRINVLRPDGFYISLKWGTVFFNLRNNEFCWVWINRICHRSSMQIEKSQSEGKQIMPETRFTEFPALCIDPVLGFLGLHRAPMIDYFSYYN